MNYIKFDEYLLVFDSFLDVYFDQKENNNLENIFIDPIRNKFTYAFLFNELINLLEKDYLINFNKDIWKSKIKDIEFQKELYFNIYMLERNKNDNYMIEYFDFKNIFQHSWWKYCNE